MDGAASDVLDATKRGGGYIGWLFVSNAPFDDDAISFATGARIGCVQYDGKGFRALNDISLQKSW